MDLCRDGAGPLVTMLNELGQDMSGGVLRERVVDTLLGCAIGLGVGYLPWRFGPGRPRSLAAGVAKETAATPGNAGGRGI